MLEKSFKCTRFNLVNMREKSHNLQDLTWEMSKKKLIHLLNLTL